MRIFPATGEGPGKGRAQTLRRLSPVRALRHISRRFTATGPVDGAGIGPTGNPDPAAGGPTFTGLPAAPPSATDPNNPRIPGQSTADNAMSDGLIPNGAEMADVAARGTDFASPDTMGASGSVGLRGTEHPLHAPGIPAGEHPVATTGHRATEHAVRLWPRPRLRGRSARAAADGDGPTRRRGRLDPLTTCVVVATAVFALAGIGTPLLGLSVFADTGSLGTYSPYREVLSGVPVQTQYQRDLVDDQMPNEMLFGQALRAGEFAAWNPYALAGGALGSTPNLAVASPLSAPFWVLPGWLAPAYVKLLELICAIGGTVLFLRRLRLSRAAAWLGGLVFASSAFMVVWTGWPQTRVAALIPALFWAVECLAQRTRPREVALVALPVAGMLLGGFPAVTGYALVTAAVYLLVRLAGQYGPRWWTMWRPILGRSAAAGAGLVAGVALVAWQLLPWAHLMSTVLLSGRAQDTSKIIPASSLLTTIAPYALGTVNPAHLPNWFGELQLIDADSYLGAAALVLVVTAIALARTGRSLLPRGVWWTLVTTSALWLIVIYFGGPALWLLQHLSFLFSDNFVGRARSVLGFLMAVLTAVGFEALLRRRRERAAAETAPVAGWLTAATWLPRHDWLIADGAWRVRRLYGVVVWSVLVGTGISIYLAGRSEAGAANAKRATGAPDAISFLNARVAVGLAIMAVAAASVSWLWFSRSPADAADPVRRRRRVIRLAALGLLPLLAAGQSLAWVESYYPRTDRANFYPTTPTQTFLATHLGHERYYGADGAIFGSVDVTAGLRSFHGHGLLDQGYADLAQTLPGEQFTIPATAIISDPAGGLAAMSPMLDRSAVDYYVTPPGVQPFGQVTAQPGDGPAVTLLPGQAITLALPVAGPLRGVGFTPVPVGDTPNQPAHVRVSVFDSKHHLVAANERSDSVDPGKAWVVPLAAENVKAGTRLTATITVIGPDAVNVASHNGRPALTAIGTARDGLRLVYAKETTIYHRVNALPRARWASATTVMPDPAARVALIASGTLKPNQVVLDRPGPAAQGKPATVNWVDDGLDQVVLDVDARGAGYVVLADAIQNGWRVSVDGHSADLVAADHAYAAVAVPAGKHTVRFFYPQPWAGPGVWISGAALVIVLVLLTTPWGRRWPDIGRLRGLVTRS